MKRIFLTGTVFFTVIVSFSQDTTHHKLTDTLMLENIEVKAITADNKAPITKTDISKQEIAQENMGQDLPFLLNQIPNVVINSDAGNGIGYTAISVRGSDPSRVNVTLNGIPYNDAESQETFFVDLPDFVSSVNSIQVERGVGTSSNGAGAFGANINLSTNEVNKDKYLGFDNSFGSFNSWKNTLKFGTGIFHKHFTFDARLSHISSDGYVDRATSHLRSLFISAAYLTKKSSLRFNLITGKEKTYQAWYGIPESYLDSARRYNPAGTEKPGSPYSNETDNYLQTHYQLFYDHKFNSNLSFNVALFLTRGKGYYEEYRAGELYSNYGLPDPVVGNDTITSTDLIRRLWLDNYFYGTIFSVQYERNKTHLTFGGGWDNYDGKHYDLVTWAKEGGFPPDYIYAYVPAYKQDLNLYGKLLQSFGAGFNAYADIQGRFVKYVIDGFEDNPNIIINKNWAFLNPKAGISWLKHDYDAYISYSIVSKEPNRDDFEAGINEQPKPETLYDLELGFGKKTNNSSYGVTFYYMDYYDQLVSTGKINDVGAYTRTNAPRSYRLGVELEGAKVLTKWLNVNGNLSFSSNKIRNFTEYVDDYDNGGQVNYQYHNSNISFSPGTVGAASINFIPVRNGEISFLSKYVGRMFLDNTSHVSRSIDPYYVQNLRFAYNLLKWKFFKSVDFIFQVNNLFDKLYESNGYTYDYISGGQLYVDNYYFPMADTNVIAAINIKL